MLKVTDSTAPSVSAPVNTGPGGAGANANNSLWFTGKSYEPSTGLSYMGARYYAPALGRFIGMDPKEVDPEDVHSFNRYAYANNNPFKYVDPDGRSPVLLIPLVWTVGNAAISGAFNAATQYLSTGQVQWRGVGGVLDAAGDGAILGPALGATTRPLSAVEGAGLSGVTGLGNQNSLYQAAVGQFKNTELSNAGRALTKHPELVGETKETLRRSLRTDGAINDAAHAALRDIMTHGVETTPALGRYGTVTQIQIPGGFGARWASDGSFIGFINP